MTCAANCVSLLCFLVLGAESNQTGAGVVRLGMTVEERQQFYHLAEGSELYPLAWLRALKNAKTGRPFLADVGRYGLIPDPDNRDGLPIGLTANESRGLPILGRMVGINCAACHVGQLTIRGRVLVIDGAPNMFDINKFYYELFTSAEATLKSPNELARFLEALAQQGDAVMARTTRMLIAGLTEAGSRQADALEGSEQRFLGRMRSLMDRAGQRARQDVSFLGLGPEGREQLRQRLAGEVREQVDGVISALDGVEQGLLRELAAVRDKTDLRQGIEELAMKTALIKARFVFLERLKDIHLGAGTTEPGPGRIDAFVNTRDLIYPKSDFLTANSPISYPYLWRLNQTVWLHCDGNTNSVLERNVGQSMALGAAVDLTTYASTILPRNLHELELLARRLEPPAWPEALLGAVDRQKALRGQAVYRARCLRCHAMPGTADGDKREKIVALEEVGTDPNRVHNFATNLGRNPDGSGGRNFAQDLHLVAMAVKQRAYLDNGLRPEEQKVMDLPDSEIRWRTNHGYVARPLVAIWATPPYLHNGSVPTLYDLMLPRGRRPKSFPVGHREYDPVRLGYQSNVDQVPADQRGRVFTFETSQPGNSNAGHTYGALLSEDDRMALLEYLKTL